MIDFGALVLAPAQNTFGVTLVVTPVLSQPGAGAYAARGIYEVVQQTLILEGGEELATTRRTLGIRLSEFAVAPRQGDALSFGGENFLIDSFTPDGQGGADLSLRLVR